MCVGLLSAADTYHSTTFVSTTSGTLKSQQSLIAIYLFYIFFVCFAAGEEENYLNSLELKKSNERINRADSLRQSRHMCLQGDKFKHI